MLTSHLISQLVPQSLQVNSGSNNIAMGAGALVSNQLGGDNIAIGLGSAVAVIDGSYNIAIGASAGPNGDLVNTTLYR